MPTQPNISSLFLPTPNTANPDIPSALIGTPGGIDATIFSAPSPSERGIRAALAAAQAAGGGIVKIPAGQIALTAPLPLVNGVIYEGAGYGFGSIGTASWAAPANPTLPGNFGTVLTGDGTFQGFWDGKSDRASAYGSAQALTANYITGCGVRNIQLNNFSYGIKCGGLYESSVCYATFENISTIGCGWGTWFENADSSIFRRIANFNYINGAHWHVSSGTTLINLGDSTCEYFLYGGGSNTTNASRNIVMGSRGSSNFNGMQVHFIGGVNNSQTFVSQACTVPTSGTSVTVTDSTKFALGVPVTFDGTGNGVTQQQIYFCKSIVDTTHITISNQFGGTALTFSSSGSSPAHILTRGFPGLELIAMDSGSTLSGTQIRGTGCESGGGAQYLIQGATGAGGPVYVELAGSINAITGLTSAQNTFQDVVVRNCPSGLTLDLREAASSVDFDNSCQYMPTIGYQSAAYQQGYTGCGVLSNYGSGFNGLFLSGVNTGFSQTPIPDIQRTSSGVIAVAQRIPLVAAGLAVATGGSSPQGAGTWGPSMGNFVALSAATFTIPAAADAYDGVPVYLYNFSGGSTTVSLASGNFAGVTTTGSFSMSSGTIALIAGMVATGNNPLWVRFL